jgi:hypothetical protein
MGMADDIHSAAPRSGAIRCRPGHGSFEQVGGLPAQQDNNCIPGLPGSEEGELLNQWRPELNVALALLRPDAVVENADRETRGQEQHSGALQIVKQLAGRLVPEHPVKGIFDQPAPCAVACHIGRVPRSRFNDGLHDPAETNGDLPWVPGPRPEIALFKSATGRPSRIGVWVPAEDHGADPCRDWFLQTRAEGAPIGGGGEGFSFSARQDHLAGEKFMVQRMAPPVELSSAGDLAPGCGEIPVPPRQHRP